MASKITISKINLLLKSATSPVRAKFVSAESDHAELVRIEQVRHELVHSEHVMLSEQVRRELSRSERVDCELAIYSN